MKNLTILIKILIPKSTIPFKKEKTLFKERVKRCQDPDLNWGHGDFQSPALPTELSRL